MYKEKYQKLKESTSRSVTASSGESYLDHARSALASQQQRINTNSEEDDTFGGFQSIRSSASKAGSHASLGSGLANHARSIVGSFSCTGSNNIARTSGVGAQELAENRDAEIREMAFRHDSGMRDRRRATNNEKRNVGGNQNIKMTYSDRSYSTDTQSQQSGGYQRRTPHSVASGSTRSKSSRSFREVSETWMLRFGFFLGFEFFLGLMVTHILRPFRLSIIVLTLSPTSRLLSYGGEILELS